MRNHINQYIRKIVVYLCRNLDHVLGGRSPFVELIFFFEDFYFVIWWLFHLDNQSRQSCCHKPCLFITIRNMVEGKGVIADFFIQLLAGHENTEDAEDEDNFSALASDIFLLISLPALPSKSKYLYVTTLSTTIYNEYRPTFELKKSNSFVVESPDWIFFVEYCAETDGSSMTLLDELSGRILSGFQAFNPFDGCCLIKWAKIFTVKKQKPTNVVTLQKGLQYTLHLLLKIFFKGFFTVYKVTHFFPVFS